MTLAPATLVTGEMMASWLSSMRLERIVTDGLFKPIQPNDGAAEQDQVEAGHELSFIKGLAAEGSQGGTALVIAASLGHASILEVLLAKGARDLVFVTP